MRRASPKHHICSDAIGDFHDHLGKASILICCCDPLFAWPLVQVEYVLMLKPQEVMGILDTSTREQGTHYVLVRSEHALVFEKPN